MVNFFKTEWTYLILPILFFIIVSYFGTMHKLDIILQETANVSEEKKVRMFTRYLRKYHTHDNYEGNENFDNRDVREKSYILEIPLQFGRIFYSSILDNVIKNEFFQEKNLQFRKMFINDFINNWQHKDYYNILSILNFLKSNNQINIDQRDKLEKINFYLTAKTDEKLIYLLLNEKIDLEEIMYLMAYPSGIDNVNREYNDDNTDLRSTGIFHKDKSINQIVRLVSKYIKEEDINKNALKFISEESHNTKDIFSIYSKLLIREQGSSGRNRFDLEMNKFDKLLAKSPLAGYVLFDMARRYVVKKSLNAVGLLETETIDNNRYLLSMYYSKISKILFQKFYTMKKNKIENIFSKSIISDVKYFDLSTSNAHGGNIYKLITNGLSSLKEDYTRSKITFNIPALIIVAYYSARKNVNSNILKTVYKKRKSISVDFPIKIKKTLVNKLK